MKVSEKKPEENNTPVTDIGSALADINKRALERKKFVSESKKKVKTASDARRANRPTKASSAKIAGLKTL